MSAFQNTNIQRTIENITEMPQKNRNSGRISKVTKNEKFKINNSTKNTYKPRHRLG